MSLRCLTPLLALLAVCILNITAQDDPAEEAHMEHQLISDFWITDYLGCCRYYPHNMNAYWTCCMKNNSCKHPCPLWSIGKKGCLYKGRWYPIGAVMELNAKKCQEIRCCPHHHGSVCKPWPPTHMLPGPHVHDVFDRCNCCEYNGQLYQNGQAIIVDDCRRWVCRNGQWMEQSNGRLPCPPGSIPYGKYCLWVEPIWLTWPQAEEICKCKGGEMIQLPDSEDERMQLVHQVNPCGGFWAMSRQSTADEGLCAAVPPGSMGRELSPISCDMRLRPVCKIPRQPCDEGQCTVNGVTYPNGTTIDTCPIHECISIVCVNGYPTTVIDPSCCEVEGPNGIDLVPSGSWFMLGNQKCVCKEGMVDCCHGGMCVAPAPAR